MANATILLVEDEDALRGLLTRYLERKGYEVIACADGNSALTSIAGGGEPVSLAIVDLTLPDISGETVVAHLLETSEQIRVIISSGRPYTVEALPEAHRGRAAAILKPYLPQELIATIEALLGPGDQASIS